MIRTYGDIHSYIKAIEALDYLKIPYSTKTKVNDRSLSGSLKYEIEIELTRMQVTLS